MPRRATSGSIRAHRSRPWPARAVAARRARGPRRRRPRTSRDPPSPVPGGPRVRARRSTAGTWPGARSPEATGRGATPRRARRGRRSGDPWAWTRAYVNPPASYAVAVSPTVIDLRSDTVTRPTPAMREAMARADVGDDLFGEDPSINRLQERVAALLDHEAGLWMPSGTMSDQVAIRTLTRPGDELLAARDAHVLWYESGGTSASSGVQVTEIGPGGGRFSVDDLVAARKPRDDLLQPPTTLVAVENTHNRAGGVVWTEVESLTVAAAARDLGLASFLDGARIWN